MNMIKNISHQKLNRRTILKNMATGSLVLGISVTGGGFGLPAFAETSGPFSPNVFVAIDPDGTLHITAHRSEMGTGIRTGLPMVVAEEMNADWARVKIPQGDGDKKYGSQNTDGSRSIRRFFDRMREAGATARLMMERAAAKQWGVAVSDVRAENHEIILKDGSKRMGFGAAAVLARDEAVPEVSELTFKARKDYRIVGTETKIIDLPAIINGTTTYGIDGKLEGLHYAVIARPPVFRGSVKSVDTAAALKIPGVVKVVEMPSLPPEGPVFFRPLGGVAVVATSTWAAMKGRDALKITWDNGPNATHNSADYMKTLDKSCDGPAKFVGRKQGDVAAALKKAETVHHATYEVPYLEHATLEPPAATAVFADGKMEVWAPVQDPQGTIMAVAGVLGVPEPDVTVHVTLLGGAFGRKSKPDFVVEAGYLAKETGLPIKVTWSREDQTRHGFYHAASVQKLSAGLDKKGKAIAWHHRLAYPTIMSNFMPDPQVAADWEMCLGAVDLPYDIKDITVEAMPAKAHVRIGWLRSVNNIQQVFAIGSFIDELAHKAGQDPKDYLLKVIGAPRAIDLDAFEAKGNYGEPLAKYPFKTKRLTNVIDLAAKKANWGRKLPKGHAQGIFGHRSFLSYIGMVVEASVEAGEVKVHQVDVAVDCGLAVNPDRIRSQMEGAVIFGLSLALLSEITIENGAVVEGNFDGYRLARTDINPEVHVHLVESDELPTGVGEPGVPPVAPALCNAIFAAIGKRIRRLPIGDQLA